MVRRLILFETHNSIESVLRIRAILKTMLIDYKNTITLTTNHIPGQSIKMSILTIQWKLPNGKHIGTKFLSTYRGFSI